MQMQVFNQEKTLRFTKSPSKMMILYQKINVLSTVTFDLVSSTYSLAVQLIHRPDEQTRTALHHALFRRKQIMLHLGCTYFKNGEQGRRI